MPGPNQLHVKRDDVRVSAADLLRPPAGTRTVAGLRHSIRVGVEYLESWLRGSGCVPLYGLMEDAATAEISRTQVWQWLRHGATLDDGQPLTRERLGRILDEEIGILLAEVGEARFVAGRYREARDLFWHLATSKPLEEFLTIPAYEYLLALTQPSDGLLSSELPFPLRGEGIQQSDGLLSSELPLPLRGEGIGVGGR
jgi:malate synthase